MALLSSSSVKLAGGSTRLAAAVDKERVSYSDTCLQGWRVRRPAPIKDCCEIILYRGVSIKNANGLHRLEVAE